MVSLNEKRSKIRYVVQNKTEWTEGKNEFHREDFADFDRKTNEEEKRENESFVFPDLTKEKTVMTLTEENRSIKIKVKHVVFLVEMNHIGTISSRIDE